MGVVVQGFAIGSAALVSLALFGAYVSRAGIATVNVIEPEVRWWDMKYLIFKGVTVRLDKHSTGP